MSDDAEDLTEFWPLLPEQYEDAMTALELFNSYLLENGKGPGTEELLATVLNNPDKTSEDNARDLTAGLLSVAATLTAMWRVQGYTPQQIIEFLRTAFTPPAD